MKTYKHIVWLCIIAIISGMADKIFAQPFVKLDVGADDSMYLKFYDPSICDKPEKVVLIFENTTVTCDFSDSVVIAMYTRKNKGYFIDEFSGQYDYDTYYKVSEKPAIDELEAEEPVRLEEWMLRPAEWM